MDQVPTTLPEHLRPENWANRMQKAIAGVLVRFYSTLETIDYHLQALFSSFQETH